MVNVAIFALKICYCQIISGNNEVTDGQVVRAGASVT